MVSPRPALQCGSVTDLQRRASGHPAMDRDGGDPSLYRVLALVLAPRRLLRGALCLDGLRDRVDVRRRSGRSGASTRGIAGRHAPAERIALAPSAFGAGFAARLAQACTAIGPEDHVAFAVAFAIEMAA